MEAAAGRGRIGGCCYTLHTGDSDRIVRMIRCRYSVPATPLVAVKPKTRHVRGVGWITMSADDLHATYVALLLIMVLKLVFNTGTRESSL